MDRTRPHSGKINSLLHFSITCLLMAVMLVSPSFTPRPVSADTPSTCILKWGVIDTPGAFPQRNDIRTPCEINSIAASSDGKVLYALDASNSSSGPVVNAGIWRSADGGISWSLRPTQWLARTSSSPIFPLADIAIAPDDPNLITAVCMDPIGTHRREVYLSEDGGTNWYYSGRIPWLYGAGEQVGGITISTPYTYQGNTVHDIIVGSRNPADSLAQGEVYILRYPGLAIWKPQGFTGGDIIALLCSPGYTTDSTLVIMSSTTLRTYINLGYRDPVAGSCSWNMYTGWPVELCTPDQAGGAASGESRIITGNLALPFDFNGTATEKRIIFATYDSNGTSMGINQPLDDVYRLNDTTVTRLRVPGYGSKPRVCSIAYAGTAKSGKLLAGNVTSDPLTASATVWFTANPLAQCAVWKKPLKAPTGGYGSGFANVKVGWTQDGLIAFCGTGSGNRDSPLKWSDPTDPSWSTRPLDESAFSLSMDDGTSWNQLGLIDTCINRFQSVEVAADGNTLYLSSVNNNGLDSTWRSRGSLAGEAWQRVACFECSAPLLRLASDKKNGAVVFLGNQGTAQITQSRDSGQTWQDCLPGAILQDMAAKGSDEMYVLQANGLVKHGAYDSGGWRWEKFTDTGISPVHTIMVLNNNILVGAASGQLCPASYSTDGGYHWILITERAYSYGNRHVAFDDEFKDNRIIYLGDDAGGLYRWAIGTNNRWDDMVPPDNSYYGLTTAGRGVLYAAYSPKGNGVDRTIYSRAGIPKNGVSWDSLTAGLNSGVLFRQEPNALVSADETVWSIDSRDYNSTSGTGCLWALKDTLANHAPWLIAPKGGSLAYCDPVTGRNAQVDLKWEQLSLAEAYEMEIAKDSWFDLLITAAQPSGNPFYMPADLLYPAYYIGDGLLPEAGHTYYWHVRVRRASTGQVIRSRWSHGLSFSIRPGYPVVVPSYPGIQSLAPLQEACSMPIDPVSFSWTPVQGTSSYRFRLSSDPDFQSNIIDEAVKGTAYKFNRQLSYRTAYFWQVTPLEPVAGDPSPVFTFTTENSPELPQPVSRQQGEAWLYSLLMVNAMVFLIFTIALVLNYRRLRGNS